MIDESDSALQKRFEKARSGPRKGSHSNVRAAGLLKAIRANKRMTPATKRKAVATIRRKHPALR